MWATDEPMKCERELIVYSGMIMSSDGSFPGVRLNEKTINNCDDLIKICKEEN